MSNKNPSYTFRAIIEDPTGGGAFVRVPFDVEQTFGKKRVKILATIDGVSYRGSLVRMGTECHLLLILKEIRQQIGKTFGDEVEITVQEDSEPRVVNVPEDLRVALEADPSARSFFDKLAYSHQREYVMWIEEAKRPETRQKRIQGIVQMLKEGKRER
jgi:hypothetical protein